MPRIPAASADWRDLIPKWWPIIAFALMLVSSSAASNAQTTHLVQRVDAMDATGTKFGQAQNIEIRERLARIEQSTEDTRVDVRDLKSQMDRIESKLDKR